MKKLIQRLSNRENFQQYLPSGGQSLFLFLNLYFPMTFLIILLAGIYALIMDIPNKFLAPPAVLFFSLVLLKQLKAKQWVAWVCFLVFPFFVYLNNYGYATAIASWYPILLNLFIVSMLQINLVQFSLACTYFLGVHIILIFMFGYFSTSLWLLSLGGSFFACAILLISLSFISHNQILLKEKNTALRINSNLLENLRTFVTSVLHDQAHWAALSHIGLAKTRITSGEVDEMLAKGLEGIHQLANQLREILKTNQFGHLQVISIADLVTQFKNQLSGHLLPVFQFENFPRSTLVRTDPQVLGGSLFNLVQNAAAAKADRVEIVTILQDANHAALLVRDNGNGLSPDTAAKLFQHKIKNAEDPARGIGLLGVQFNLNCLNCDIQLEHSNIGGKSWTVFKITGLEILSSVSDKGNGNYKSRVLEKTAGGSVA